MRHHYRSKSILEKDFQSKFGKWLKANWKLTTAFELKLTKTKSLSFSAVKEHQEYALRLAKKKLYYKIPDDTYSQKPFDTIFLANTKAFVVIMFYVRGQKEFIMIDIDVWIKEKLSSTRKSITEERAKELGKVYFL